MMPRREEDNPPAEDEFDLTCPNCGQTGTVQLEAIPNPAYPGFSTVAIKSLSEGFEAQGGQQFKERAIVCTKCSHSRS